MDKYAALAPGAGNRGCRRADGGPKRRYSEGHALQAVEAVNAHQREQVHAYACTGGCGPDVWHVGRDPAAVVA